jgi:hypothetical protein
MVSQMDVLMEGSRAVPMVSLTVEQMDVLTAYWTTVCYLADY